MEITNAGAGAGKTATLADKIKERYEQRTNPYTHIFVITYSNYATKVITRRIETIYGEIPKYIHLSTIHSFLWNYVIEPYHYLLFDQQFTQISSQTLENNVRYRNQKVAELKRSNILHVKEFSKIAKKVLVGGSKQNKTERKKREKILKQLENFIDSIFIDESQDMEKEMADCISSIDKTNINCFLVGDENQDLHSRGGFSALIKQYPERVFTKKENYRCPSRHVEVSNLFLEYDQIAMSEISGNIQYTFEIENDIIEFLEKSTESLIFINKSLRNFQIYREKKSEIEQLQYILRKQHKDVNGFEDISSQASKKWAFDMTRIIIKCLDEKKATPEKITSKLRSFFNSGYDKRKYAELIQGIQNVMPNKKKSYNFPIKSIESVKGSQNDNCIFLMSTDLFAYLIQEKTERNATLNALYVGLTRSTKNLLVIFTEEVTNKYDVTFIEERMKELGILKFKEV
jgi:superfamily I DNA/RNA helicase